MVLYGIAFKGKKLKKVAYIKPISLAGSSQVRRKRLHFVKKLKGFVLRKI